MVTGSKGMDGDKGVEEWIQDTYNKGDEVLIFNRCTYSRQFVCTLFGHIQVFSACLASPITSFVTVA